MYSMPQVLVVSLPDVDMNINTDILIIILLTFPWHVHSVLTATCSISPVLTVTVYTPVCYYSLKSLITTTPAFF